MWHSFPFRVNSMLYCVLKISLISTTILRIFDWWISLLLSIICKYLYQEWVWNWILLFLAKRNVFWYYWHKFTKDTKCYVENVNYRPNFNIEWNICDIYDDTLGNWHALNERKSGPVGDWTRASRLPDENYTTEPHRITAVSRQI